MEMLVKGYKAFKLQKEGNPPDYCEDDWEVKESDEMLRCAVTDGATDSFFSGFWASLLASSYCAGDMSVENFNASIDELQAIWLERVDKMKLPWYAEEKSKSGAFAAIVGLTVHYGARDGRSRSGSSNAGGARDGSSIEDSHSYGIGSNGSECNGREEAGRLPALPGIGTGALPGEVIGSELRGSEEAGRLPALPGNGTRALPGVFIGSESHEGEEAGRLPALPGIGTRVLPGEVSGSELHGSEEAGRMPALPGDGTRELPWDGTPALPEELRGSESDGCAASEQNPRRWEAFALGDCCLFQYRKGKLILSLPLTESAEFNSCPYLISSREENNKDISKLFVRREGTWEAGDQFLLMSDAIACWLLQQEERNEAPLLELESIRDDEEFREWIAELRSTKGENGRPLLKNDDVTIFHLSLPEEVL